MRATVICRGHFIDGLFRADDKTEMKIKQGDVVVFWAEEDRRKLKQVGPEYIGPVWLGKVEADA